LNCYFNARGFVTRNPLWIPSVHGAALLAINLSEYYATTSLLERDLREVRGLHFNE